MHASRIALAGSLIFLVLLSGCVAPSGNGTFGGEADAAGTPTPSPTPRNETAPSPTPSTSPEPKDPEPSDTPTPDPTPEGKTHTVSIGKTIKGVAADYSPEPVRIKVGDSVVWKNLDSVVHTATADDESFDTGSIGGGKSSEALVFDKAGTFKYYCKAHASTMKGAEVIVE